MLPIFVYGTLRTASWNHERWLAPWLAGACRPAVLPGHALHRHDGLPYVVATPGREVAGEVAVLDPDRYETALARLDVLEDVERRHYDRAQVRVRLGDGLESEADREQVWVWVAGPRIQAVLGAASLVASGDFLLVEPA